MSRYLEIEPRYVSCTEDYLIMSPEKAIDLMDENTIGCCAILGSTVSDWGCVSDTDSLLPKTDRIRMHAFASLVLSSILVTMRMSRR